MSPRYPIVSVLNAAIFMCLAFPVVALDLDVEYVDGYLDVRDGEEWFELFVGDTVSDSDTIRLDEDSIAELSTRGTKLTVTKPGIYMARSLLDASGEQRSFGLASVVSGKVASLFRDLEGESQAAVMGVRGAKSESNVQWMSGDTAELLDAGKGHLEESELDEALALFEEAYDFAEIDEETEVLFSRLYDLFHGKSQACGRLSGRDHRCRY